MSTGRHPRPPGTAAPGPDAQSLGLNPWGHLCPTAPRAPASPGAIHDFMCQQGGPSPTDMTVGPWCMHGHSMGVRSGYLEGHRPQEEMDPLESSPQDPVLVASTHHSAIPNTPSHCVVAGRSIRPTYLCCMRSTTAKQKGKTSKHSDYGFFLGGGGSSVLQLAPPECSLPSPP